MVEHTFRFWATRFYGLDHEDEPRQESITIHASNFTEASEKLRQKLHDFRGSNSFDNFIVNTSKGLWMVSTEPSPVFDIYGILNSASFTLGERLVAAR